MRFPPPFYAATMTKIIKEMLPPDVRVARDAQDLLIECCVGETIQYFLLHQYEFNFIFTQFHLGFLHYIAQ